MTDSRTSGPSLFETLGIPPLLGLLVVFCFWLYLTWYWWTHVRGDIAEFLEPMSARRAHQWRAGSKWFGVVWTVGFALSFAAAFIKELS